MEWAIFGLKPCVAMILYWLSNGLIYMNMSQWAPTYFQEEFGVTAAAAGSFLAMANFLHIPGNFASGLLESALMSRYTVVTIRRGMTLAAAASMGASSCLFGLAGSARQATAAFCLFVVGQQFNNCGIIPNFWELGG